MTWQLLGSGDGPWEIQDTEGPPRRRVAIIRHCDIETARLFAAALKMREAAVALAEAVGDYHLTGPNDRSEKEWIASGFRMLAVRQQVLKLAATGEEEHGDVQD